jgi:fatty-acid desaturase
MKMIWARINEFTKSAIEKLWPYTQNALKVLYKISFCYDVLCRVRYVALCRVRYVALYCVTLCSTMFFCVNSTRRMGYIGRQSLICRTKTLNGLYCMDHWHCLPKIK